MSELQNCLFSLQVLPKTLKRMKFMILRMCQSTTIREIFTECYLYNLFLAFYVASIPSQSLFEESSTFMTTSHFWPYSWRFLTGFVTPMFIALEVSHGCVCSVRELTSRWSELLQTAALLWGVSIRGQVSDADAQNSSAKRKIVYSIVSFKTR